MLQLSTAINNINFSISEYDYDDFKNEFYRILFRCISLYKIEYHKFVAYATNGIKNSINDLIRSSIKTNDIHGYGTAVYGNYVKETYLTDKPKKNLYIISFLKT